MGENNFKLQWSQAQRNVEICTQKLLVHTVTCLWLAFPLLAKIFNSNQAEKLWKCPYLPLPVFVQISRRETEIKPGCSGFNESTQSLESSRGSARFSVARGW